MIKACLFDLPRILVSPSKNRSVRESLSEMPDTLLPGALDFIKDLHRNHIKLASTSTGIRAGSILSGMGLFSLFGYVVDSGKVAARPSPAALLLAAEHLNVAPADCVAFEHTIEGVEAAKAAGMRCVAVGDLSKLYHADMGVPSVKGLNLLWLKDGLEVPEYSC